MQTDTNTDLIPIESINATELFVEKKMDLVLANIEHHAKSLVPSVSSEEGRKQISSMAYKVARYKTTIDDMGKNVVAEWKAKSAAVDATRKRAREFLDALRDDVRKPLNEWEAEQERLAQAARDEEQRKKDEAERARVAEIERREAELKAKEDAMRKVEEEARAKIEAERLAQEKLAYEERIRKEAAEKAEREAVEAKERARIAEERAVREAEAAKERERLAAIKAEQDRKAAAERAEREKLEAIRRAEERLKKEADAREQARLNEIAKQRAEEERRAKDRAHRKTVMGTAEKAFVEEGFAPDVAEKIVALIAAGNVPNITIQF